MSRTDGSAYPGLPADADYPTVSAALHRDSDELPDVSDYDQALWPILAGDVIQPRCMCGAWSSVAECDNCQRTLEEFGRWEAADRKDREERAAWRKPSSDSAA